MDNEKLSFMELHLEINRKDNARMRDMIAKISYSQWKKTGFSKGTL